MNNRQLVLDTLEFKNITGKVPIDLWLLPWSIDHFASEIKGIQEKFPSSFSIANVSYEKKPKTIGSAYEIGTFIDEWGCEFENIHSGIIGEVKNPIVDPDDEEWDDISKIHIPEEWLSFKESEVNEFCKNTDNFVFSDCCPRPFEQLQFIRTTQQLYVDIMLKPKKMFEFIEKMHDFYCRLLTKWAKTNVDGLRFMDDWGSQKSLLINPTVWREIFAPMYKDYIDIAHKYNKKIFMHSDGNTLEIYPDLIEMGLDAINSQIFCIGIDKLKQFKGKITFWGEIDRQHLLPNGTTTDIKNAVLSVKENLWENGGCIAQCEFGPGAKPENVYKVYETWNSECIVKSV